ncbi:hypothetical protein HGRIS_012260 [Hohenbuehelia grisea]|uniref:Uncharacterized protein n=1 Tax=Hohenbuehelia grisea TaxID=104357 RepID=A0ABR3IRS0_9AGAR
MPTRQCLQSLKHLPRCADVPLRSKTFHSSAPAAAMPVAALSEPEIVIPPIFDIFDVPERLGQSQAHLMGNATPSSSKSRSFQHPAPRKMPTSTPTNSLPASLPPPITFDGPARPRHPGLAPHVFAPRAPRAGATRSSSSASGPHHAAMWGADQEDSEVLVQVFDGPARITRYAHRPQAGSGPSGKNGGLKSGAVVLGAAGVVAGMALVGTSA